MKLSRIIVNGVALIVAALVVPDIHLAWKAEPSQTLITLLVLAVIFAIINGYIRPILQAFSLPLNILTMGLFSFLLNAGLLILLAWVVDLVWKPVFRLGDFPVANMSLQTIEAAIVGGLVVSIVSTAMTVLLPDV